MGGGEEKDEQTPPPPLNSQTLLLRILAEFLSDAHTHTHTHRSWRACRNVPEVNLGEREAQGKRRQSVEFLWRN